MCHGTHEQHKRAPTVLRGSAHICRYNLSQVTTKSPCYAACYIRHIFKMYKTPVALTVEKMYRIEILQSHLKSPRYAACYLKHLYNIYRTSVSQKSPRHAAYYITHISRYIRHIYKIYKTSVALTFANMYKIEILQNALAAKCSM